MVSNGLNARADMISLHIKEVSFVTTSMKVKHNSRF